MHVHVTLMRCLMNLIIVVANHSAHGPNIHLQCKAEVAVAWLHTLGNTLTVLQLYSLTHFSMQCRLIKRKGYRIRNEV